MRGQPWENPWTRDPFRSFRSESLQSTHAQICPARFAVSVVSQEDQLVTNGNGFADLPLKAGRVDKSHHSYGMIMLKHGALRGQHGVCVFVHVCAINKH